jgi:integrase
VKPLKGTAHYTLEEAENIISALVDHVDAQLVMALSFFLGLRPGEIAGLKWEDFDETQFISAVLSSVASLAPVRRQSLRQHCR